MKGLNMNLYEILTKLGVNTPGFNRGLLVGVCSVIILLFIIRIIFLYFKRKCRCKGLPISTEKGDLFIASKAITDLILAVAEGFENIKISKIKLIKCRSTYSVKITTSLAHHDVNFQSMMTSMQTEILAALKKSLGIDKIEKVDILLKRVK